MVDTTLERETNLGRSPLPTTDSPPLGLSLKREGGRFRLLLRAGGRKANLPAEAAERLSGLWAGSLDEMSTLLRDPGTAGPPTPR